MANAIKNFHFDFLKPSLTDGLDFNDTDNIENEENVVAGGKKEIIPI